jgi:hypothetical protein
MPRALVSTVGTYLAAMGSDTWEVIRDYPQLCLIHNPSISKPGTLFIFTTLFTTMADTRNAKMQIEHAT